MKNLMKTLVALSATTALLAVGPAFARGGGGGGHGGGGHASFGGKSSFSSMGPISRDRSSEHRSATYSVPQKATLSKETRHHERSHRQVNTERKVVRDREVRKVEAKKLTADSHKAVKIAAKPVMPGKRVAVAQKLTDHQYARAKLADSKGRHYNAEKKAWTDGKGRWWYGRFAWVFIDDAWYYGNSRWTFSDGDWSCDSVVAAAKPTRRIIVEAPSAKTSTPEAVQAETAVETQAAPKPNKSQSLAKKPPQGQMQQSEAQVAKTKLPSIETAALASPPVAPSNPVDTAQPVTPVEVAQTAGPVDCKRFLPNLSLTISVPCSE